MNFTLILVVALMYAVLAGTGYYLLRWRVKGTDDVRRLAEKAVAVLDWIIAPGHPFDAPLRDEEDGDLERDLQASPGLVNDRRLRHMLTDAHRAFALAMTTVPRAAQLAGRDIGAPLPDSAEKRAQQLDYAREARLLFDPVTERVLALQRFLRGGRERTT